MAVHLSGRQRDFLSHTFPRPPGDGWAFRRQEQENSNGTNWSDYIGSRRDGW